MSRKIKSISINNFLPKKHLGQNFLISQRIIEKIIHCANVRQTDNILEVGPGQGALTFKLAEKAQKVIAIEKDSRLFKILSVKKEELKLKDELILINQDILKIKSEDLKNFFSNEPYKVVANLPYQITSFFLRQFLQTDYPPTEMVLMVQKEVGERIIAKPGKMSMLAVAVQFFAAPEIVFCVNRKNFSPAPRVDSVILRLKNISPKKYNIAPEIFFALVKQGFCCKRKQLKNNLKLPAGFLKNAGFREDIRAEQLSVENWIRLSTICLVSCGGI